MIKALPKGDWVLAQYSVGQLIALTKAGQSLGIDLNADGAIDNHFIARQRISHELGGGMLAVLAGAIADDEPAAALAMLRDLRQLHADYGRINRFIRGDDAPHAAAVPALNASLLEGSIKEMERIEDRPIPEVVLTQLDEDDWTALANRLESAGKALSRRSGATDKEMGLAMTADAQLLNGLRSWARSESRAEDVVPRPDAERASVVRLDKPMHDALQQRYGMVPGPDGRPSGKS